MRSVRLLVAALVAPVVLTGCLTGQRAHFAPDAAQVSDPAITAVLAKLEAANTGQFTATYSLLTKFGDVTTQATVAQTSPVAKSITVGTVRFLTLDISNQTCELTTSTCVDSFDDAQISNLSFSHDFYAVSPAARIRQDATTMVGPAIGSTQQIAGQSATCVQVSFAGAGNNKKYCALDSGLLALQDTPDLRIELLGLTTGADQSLFTTSTTPSG